MLPAAALAPEPSQPGSRTGLRKHWQVKPLLLQRPRGPRLPPWGSQSPSVLHKPSGARPCRPPLTDMLPSCCPLQLCRPVVLGHVQLSPDQVPCACCSGAWNVRPRWPPRLVLSAPSAPLVIAPSAACSGDPDYIREPTPTAAHATSRPCMTPDCHRHHRAHCSRVPVSSVRIN